MGVRELDKELYKKYLGGEIDYETWIGKISEKWKGNELTKEYFSEKFRYCSELNCGANDFVKELESRGYEIVLASGGLQGQVEEVVRKLDINGDLSMMDTNRIIFDSRGLFKRLEPGIYPFDRKDDYLDDMGVDEKNVFAMGDSDNDLPMLRKVQKGGGIAVLFNPSEMIEDMVEDVEEEGIEVIKSKNYEDVIKLLDEKSKV